MAFECKHCGQCCINTATQINLSLGDIKRFSELTGKSVKELFAEGLIGMQPFQTVENPDVFDIELGLSIPCKFRINEKCSIYGARPLNCRMFPFWIIAEVSSEQATDFIDPECRCGKELQYNKEDQKKYKEYKDKISEILIEEAEITDEFLKREKIIKKIDISKIEGYSKFLEEIEKEQDIKKIDTAKIGFCKKNIDKSDYDNVINLIEEEISKHDFKTIEFLKEFEKILV